MPGLPEPVEGGGLLTRSGRTRPLHYTGVRLFLYLSSKRGIRTYAIRLKDLAAKVVAVILPNYSTHEGTRAPALTIKYL